MNTVKWDPFHNLLNVPRFGASSALTRSGDERPWAPTVDIFEKDDDVFIRAELPGVSRDDIDVSVEDGVLTLSGERKTDERFHEAGVYRRERSFGRFKRGFAMPDTVDTDRIEARYKDGILEIRVPKVERLRPRKIEIDAA